MKNLTLGRIAEVCGGTYFGKEEERTEREEKEERKEIRSKM